MKNLNWRFRNEASSGDLTSHLIFRPIWKFLVELLLMMELGALGNKTWEHAMENKNFIKIKKAARHNYILKLCLFVFFFNHKEEKMVNQHCYVGVLIGLRKAFIKKRPNLWPNSWFLHHNNAPVQEALSFFLDKKQTYSFGTLWLLAFPKNENDNKGIPIFRCFCYLEACDQNIKELCRKLFEQWRHYLVKCIGAQEEYFERDILLIYKYVDKVFISRFLEFYSHLVLLVTSIFYCSVMW